MSHFLLVCFSWSFGICLAVIAVYLVGMIIYGVFKNGILLLIGPFYYVYRKIKARKKDKIS